MQVQSLTNHDRIALILECVKKKGSKAFVAFCKVLCRKNIDQENVVTDVLGLDIEDLGIQSKYQRDSNRDMTL